MAKRKKIHISKGIRMSMPDMVKRGNSLATELIGRHGAKQASIIGRMIAEKTLAALKSQERKEKK